MFAVSLNWTGMRQRMAFECGIMQIKLENSFHFFCKNAVWMTLLEFAEKAVLEILKWVEDKNRGQVC